MRRAGDLWPQVLAFDNLLRAAKLAARGKREQPAVARFLERREPELLHLRRELESGAYRPGPPRTFVIHEPKERTISVLPFRDRVVHHALIGPLEPVFERRMLSCSYASRKGKGQHAALDHAQRLVRRHRYFLKLDVQHCFESLRHDVILESVQRAVKDRRVLALCAAVLVATPGPAGVPIGALTSQWFANLVLDRLDHHVKQTLRVRGYARYMDDTLYASDDKDRLREVRDEVAAYLDRPLGLQLKHRATILGLTRYGAPFLGWQVFPKLLRLRPANLRLVRRRLARRLGAWQCGLIDEEQLAASVRSVCAHLARGNTLQLRRALFER